MPDFPADKAPDYRAAGGREGMDAISGDDPFMMMADGRAWLFAPSGLLDGPLPTHYEPVESPVHNLLYPQIDADPAAIRWRRPENPLHAVEDPRYPVVATTFRLTEQHTAGGMSRKVPWLGELQPEMFAEIDPVLARERGIEDGDWMTIETERAEIEARAQVTERMRPLRIDGRRVHQIGLPWHWGYSTPYPGDSANDLTAITGDPNVSIQESKAFTCEVRAGPARAGRRPSACGAPRAARAGGAGPGRSAGREPAGDGAVSATAAAPTELAVHRVGAQRMGFFTDTTVCIGCKACEVACKQWNDLPADGSQSRRAARTTTPASCRRRPGGTSRFVELLEPSEERRAQAAEARRRGPGARSTSRRPWPTWTAGSSCPTCASTARTPAASTRARRAR